MSPHETLLNSEKLLWARHSRLCLFSKYQTFQFMPMYTSSTVTKCALSPWEQIHIGACRILYSTTMLGVRRTHLKIHSGEKSKNRNQCDNEQIHIGACRIPYSATMLGVRGPWPSLPKWEETKSKTICYQHRLQTPTVRGYTTPYKFETIAHKLILNWHIENITL